MKTTTALFWHSIVMIIHAAVMLLALLLFSAKAAEVTLRWNESSASEAVISYEVTATNATSEIKTISLTNEATVKGITPGEAYTYTVRARNLFATSPPSAPVTYIAPPYVRLTIQRSVSLSTWEDTTTTITFPLKASEFFRLKLETIK